MVTRKHPQITEKQKKQYYYFSQWDYCPRCKDVFFDEKNKVLNEKGHYIEEMERQQNFLSSI